MGLLQLPQQFLLFLMCCCIKKKLFCYFFASKNAFVSLVQVYMMYIIHLMLETERQINNSFCSFKFVIPHSPQYLFSIKRSNWIAYRGESKNILCIETGTNTSRKWSWRVQNGPLLKSFNLGIQKIILILFFLFIKISFPMNDTFFLLL